MISKHFIALFQCILKPSLKHHLTNAIKCYGNRSEGHTKLKWLEHTLAVALASLVNLAFSYCGSLAIEIISCPDSKYVLALVDLT